MEKTVSESVIEKIESYHPQGQLDQTARVFLSLSAIRHPQVKEHGERVALLTEAVALKLDWDANAAFFGGLLHDTGKLVLPSELFDGHNVTPEEYALIKEHARYGFDFLSKIPHLFLACCSGLHHNMYKAGYGIGIEEFPDDWNPATIKKMLEISALISIADFIDSFKHRQTKILDGSDSKGPDLETMLMNKYPNDHLLVKTALVESIW